MLTAENEKYKKYLFCYSDKSWIIVLYNRGCIWFIVHGQIFIQKCIY